MTIDKQRLFHASLFLVPALLLTTKNVSVAIIGLAVLFSFYYLLRNHKQITVKPIDWLFVVCLSAYFLSAVPLTIFDGDSMRYFRGGSRIILCALLYIALRNLNIDRHKSRTYLEWGVIVGTTGAFLLALFQYFIEGRPRVDGFLYSINFGFLSCSLTLLAFCLAKHSARKTILYVTFILGCFATLLTMTRGAILAIPLLIILAQLLYARSLKIKKIVLALLAGISLCTGLYLGSSAIKQRVDYTTQEFSHIAEGDIAAASSTGGRIQLWIAATEAFKHRPLIGSTHKEREAQIRQLYQSGRLTAWTLGVPRGHAHSQYFDMLASGGVFGIAGILFMLFVPLGYFIRHARHSEYASIGAVFVSGFCLFGITEVALQQNLISTFYGYILAVLFVFSQQELCERKEALNDTSAKNQVSSTKQDQDNRAALAADRARSPTAQL